MHVGGLMGIESTKVTPPLTPFPPGGGYPLCQPGYLSMRMYARFHTSTHIRTGRVMRSLDAIRAKPMMDGIIRKPVKTTGKKEEFSYTTGTGCTHRTS